MVELALQSSDCLALGRSSLLACSLVLNLPDAPFEKNMGSVSRDVSYDGNITLGVTLGRGERLKRSRCYIGG